MSERRPITPQPGSSLPPDSFVGRARTTRIALNRLAAGTNLLLADPRRMGKTEWLRHFRGTQAERYRVILIDYEGVDSRAAFLTRTAEVLARELPTHGKLVERIKTFFDGSEFSLDAKVISLKKAFIADDPLSILERVIDALAESAGEDPRLVVAMDEVPIAALNIIRNEGEGAADLLLQSLRKIRDDHTEIRWILCGSVGFHHVLRKCHTTEGVLNNLDNLPLGPLADEEAEELATRLLQGTMDNPTPADAQHLSAICGGIPFLMHKIASLLLDAGASGPLVERIDAQFEDFLADRDESRAVTHLVTRLDGFYEGDELKIAENLLDRLALLGQPCPIEDLAASVASTTSEISTVADQLCDDHYLKDTDTGLAWRYDVLRRIWVARRRLR